MRSETIQERMTLDERSVNSAKCDAPPHASLYGIVNAALNAPGTLSPFLLANAVPYNQRTRPLDLLLYWFMLF
jgi:hypothetical protein